MPRTIKVAITVEFTDQELRTALKDAGAELTSVKAFNEFIQSEEFQMLMAQDLKQCWSISNEDDTEGLLDLFSMVIKQEEYDR